MCNKYQKNYQIHVFDPIENNLNSIKNRCKSSQVIFNEFAIGNKNDEDLIYFKNIQDGAASLFNRLDMNSQKCFISHVK